MVKVTGLHLLHLLRLFPSFSIFLLHLFTSSASCVLPSWRKLPFVWPRLVGPSSWKCIYSVRVQIMFLSNRKTPAHLGALDVSPCVVREKEICCTLVLISERYGNKGSNTANNKLTVLRVIKASRPATRSQSTGEKLPFGSLADRVVGWKASSDLIFDWWL